MKTKNNIFYCFSPPVMIATFTIELLMLGYVVWRYKLNTVGRLVALMLGFLALFQISEYYVCAGTINAEVWARAGFISITLLPALGLHAAVVISKVSSAIKYLPMAAYAHAGWWVGVFAFSKAFTSYGCTSNYAVFQLSGSGGHSYFAYYYIWLMVALIFCFVLANKSKGNRRISLQLLMMGYFVFLLPTTIVNTLEPTTMDGIPSIMCGFAVIFAIILTFGIMPRVGKQIRQIGALRLPF